MIMLGRFVMTHTTATLLAMLTLSFATSTGFAQSLTMPPEPLSVPTDVVANGGVGDSGLSLPTPTETPLGVETYSGPSAPSSAYSSGSGSVYNPTLGAHIRARYTSESYGQHSGNFDLGTMKLWNVDGGVVFFDGQVTLNDTSRVGYNLGLGYRWMTLPLFPNSPDDAKIMGVSIWADGQGADGENFFPQIGTSLEFLGDRLDFRANGYAVVGDSTQTRDFIKTGERGFAENNIAELTIGTLDTALTVGEVEIAGRIMDLDAWIFGGVYSFAGDGISETGGKIGLRGYASPDLALSIAITNDPLFDTNAVFGATWFIGRTRRENYPCGTLRDRMRQPVIRNNYVSIARSKVNGTADIATDANGDALRVVHVDSTAAAGGDGTFENPLNSLNDINGNSLDGDIVLAHADSVFSGQSAALRDDQTFVGEGGGNAFSITTTEFGTIDLPESTSGALNAAIPSINASPVAGGVVLADDNTVQNLAFDGGVNAIISDSLRGSANAQLRNLTIANTTGDGIALAAFDRVDTEDTDNDGNTTETFNILGNVVIDRVTFTGVAGADISINAASTADNNSGETIALSNITTTGNTGSASIDIRNTNGTTNDTVTIDTFTYTGGLGSQGAIALDSNKSIISVTNSTITGGGGIGVDITNLLGVANTETVSIGSTVNITNVAGTAVNVNGNTGAVDIEAVISTTGATSGGNVVITNNEALVEFKGDITANNVTDAVVVINGAQANVNIAGNIDSQGTGNAIRIANAGIGTTDNAEITFTGTVTNAQGSSVIITDGDDLITFTQDITDNGAGIQISTREAGDAAGDSRILFGGQTTLNTGGSTAVSLNNNHADSIVDFTELDITTTGVGTGIFSNGGQLNVTGADSTITTATGQALNLAGGSSQNGLTFASVNVDGAPNAIDLNDFDGTVTVNDGLLTTTQEAVTVVDSGLVLNSVDIDSGTDQAIVATFSKDTARLLSVTEMDANGGDFDFDASATGQATVTLTDITEGGAVSFLSSSSNNNSLTLTNVVTDAGFDYDVTGTGDLGIAMTNVTVPVGVVTVIDAMQTSTGNLSLAVTDSNLNGATGDAVILDGVGGIVDFNNVEIKDGAGRALVIMNGDGSFDFDAQTIIENQTGDALTIDEGNGEVDYDGTITNTAGRSVLVQNKTGGGVQLGASSTIDDTGTGILVNNNTAGNYDFLGTNTINTSGANDAVTATNNTGSILTFAGLDIDTVDGAGFTAKGGGTVSVIGTNNSVTTTGTGTGVEIDGMIIGGAGVEFSDVTVNAGTATNGILLNELTGGRVTVNGGTLNTTSNAISATNVAGLTVNGVTVTNSGADAVNLVNNDANAMDVTFSNLTVTAATGQSIEASHTGAGNFDLRISNSTFFAEASVAASGTGELDLFVSNTDIETGDNVVGFDLNLSGALSDADISFNTVDIDTDNEVAFNFDTAGSDKDVRFALLNSTIVNQGVGFEAFDGDITGTTKLDATIDSNTFTNLAGGANEPFNLTGNGSNVTIELNMTSNTATTGSLTLNNVLSAATFDVFDLPNADANNGNDMQFLPLPGDFGDFGGTVETPTD